MDSINYSHQVPSVAQSRTFNTFLTEERREIQLWSMLNKSKLESIKRDVNYLYRGQYVQTLRRKVWEQGGSADGRKSLGEEKKKKKKEGKERKQRKGKTLQELRDLNRNNENGGAGSSQQLQEEESTQNNETSTSKPTSFQIGELLFVGLYTQTHYDTNCQIVSNIRKKIRNLDEISMESPFESESSSSSDDEDTQNNQSISMKGRPPLSKHKRLHLLKKLRNIKRLKKQLDLDTRLNAIENSPESNGVDTMMLFQRNVLGLESYPKPLKVGKVYRQSPRIDPLLATLSLDTQKFLAKRSQTPLRCLNSLKEPKSIFGAGNSDVVSVRFYNYIEATTGNLDIINGFSTAKQMVSSILFRSFFEQQYELARYALGVYVRTPDSDYRFVYTMAYKLIQQQLDQQNDSSYARNNHYTSSSKSPEKDEEFIRWMCVAYPTLVDQLMPQKNKRTHKSVDFHVFLLLKLLKKPWPGGYTEALEVLEDLVARVPYVDEPIFYLLRIVANTMLAHDSGSVPKEDRIRKQEIVQKRLKSIDQVYLDFEKIKTFGDEKFYPEDLVQKQLSILNDLEERLRNEDEESDEGSSDSENKAKLEKSRHGFNIIISESVSKKVNSG